MKVIEVQFDGHVRMPGSQRGTNVLRLRGDNQLGPSVIVDSLVEDEIGVTASLIKEKDGMQVRYVKRYPWVAVTEVAYEPEPVALVEKPEEKPKKS